MKDFWLSCGHHLLDRDECGRLVVTDEFLKAYFARPELAPPPDAAPVERTLHAALLANPRRRVEAADIGAIADADARENWELMITFRNRLLAHKTVEAAYLQLAREGFGRTPPLFISQLVHVILRNVLDRCEDPYVLRAAELFFRPQRVSAHNGSLIAADEEVIAAMIVQPISPLVAMLDLTTSPSVDVLVDQNSQDYWDRSDLFDVAIDLTAGQRGLAALGEVIARWVSHFLSIEVEIEPLVEADDVALTWYVGLDAESTKIGDALWNGEALDAARRARIVGLYRASVQDPEVMLDSAKGDPIYLILATTPDGELRMKPQNLLTGLPFRHLEAVT